MIKKAIIPAAGLGTRFLPATKAQPKEMLPIVDKPTIQYIIEEAVASGIEDILIVSGRGKRAIEDHFDKSFELEANLVAKNKFAELEAIQKISEMANIHYIRQREPLGLGHAIWTARKFIGQEPFAVLLGDDIVVSEKPCLQQLIDVYNVSGTSVVGVQAVSEDAVHRYGIVNPKDGGPASSGQAFALRGLVEKPKREEAPSQFAIMGRYILQPEILTILENQNPGAGGEIQLTDAINTLNQSAPVMAVEFEGERYDVGDKFGFVRATIDFSLRRADLQDEMKAYLRELHANNYNL